MEVRILYFDGCPNAEMAERRIRDAVGDRTEITVVTQRVADPEEAETAGMHGSPTILIDGVAPFAGPEREAAWACRLYPSGSGAHGAPSLQQLKDALKR